MNKFSEEEIKTLQEFGFVVEANYAKRIRELVVESISRSDKFCTEVSVKKFHAVKTSTSLGEAMSHIDLLRDQIRKELKELLQQL